MSWNYRVVKRVNPCGGTDFYELMEVYYTDGKVRTAIETGIFSHTLEGMNNIITVIGDATAKDVLIETTMIGSK